MLAYTGDSGPDAAVIDLAHDADLLLAEATYVGPVPPGAQGFLSRRVGRAPRPARRTWP
ncbi:MAG: hypothetical protein WAK82_07095 [Streptosporangiaceae bacterium]